MFGDDTFKKLVWSQTYRAQLLYHVVVIQTNLAVFVVATTTRIIYTVFVRFLEADINQFLSLADGIYHKHLVTPFHEAVLRESSLRSSFGAEYVDVH
jgi:hypothetical protein